jgi:putative transposase
MPRNKNIILFAMLNKERKIARFKEFDYSAPAWYYITICACDKKRIFGNVTNENMILNKTGLIAKECWNNIPKHFSFTELDEYVIMPNHIHGILIINCEDIVCHGTNNKPPTIHRNFSQPVPKSLSTVIGSFKAATTRAVHNLIDNKVTIWQSRFYEHILRSEKDLFNTRQYILNNPLKWQLDEYYCC